MRRAFTVFQLMTILEENHHSFLIVEHDPLLYEDAGEMVEYLAQALKQTSREATILLYAPALDPHLQKMTELADRVFCIYSEQAPAKGRKAEAKMPGAQSNAGGILMRWPWRRQARAGRAQAGGQAGPMELETAKEILAEVFHARPGEVEEMIQRRLEERSWPEEEETWQKEREERRWPATFCLDKWPWVEV